MKNQPQHLIPIVRKDSSIKKMTFFLFFGFLDPRSCLVVGDVPGSNEETTSKSHPYREKRLSIEKIIFSVFFGVLASPSCLVVGDIPCSIKKIIFSLFFGVLDPRSCLVVRDVQGSNEELTSKSHPNRKN